MALKSLKRKNTNTSIYYRCTIFTATSKFPICFEVDLACRTGIQYSFSSSAVILSSFSSLSAARRFRKSSNINSPRPIVVCGVNND
jgi:hypothetical protein